ncbi:MAG: hypothetical protein RMK18_00030 [Armatimonadota bacterium]|nr:hypothetical protein [Armatimonadota bacterium]MCX7776446.1 hypothetical protein [Armatimonadota bacterium]MDW8024244.1 hypothetical protein [Armatimonadota bacterium]
MKKGKLLMIAVVAVSVVVVFSGCGGGSKPQNHIGSGDVIGTVGSPVDTKFPGLGVRVVDPAALKVEALLPPPVPGGWLEDVPTYIALYGTTLTELSVAYHEEEKIAFASLRTGNYEIFLIDPYDRRVQRSTSIAQHDYWPAWSPDGSKIAFESMRTGAGDIYLMNPDGSGLLGPIAASSAEELQPSFSPDGNQIVFVSKRDGNSELYVYDLRTAALRRVTNSTSEEVDPKFTPDGRMIVFASNFDGDYELCSLPATAVNAASTTFTKLTSNTVADRYPTCNPVTGKWPEIIYCSLVGSGNTWELYGYTDWVRLTNNSFHDLYPSFSPDGWYVVFAQFISQYYELRTLRLAEPYTIEQLTDGWRDNHSIQPSFSGFRTFNRRVFVAPSGILDQSFTPPFGMSISAAIIGGGGKEVQARMPEGLCAIGIVARTPGSVKITGLPNVSGQDALVVDVEADEITKVLEDTGPGNRPTEWVGSGGQVSSASEIVLVFSAKWAALMAVIAPSRGGKLKIAQDGSSVIVRGDLVLMQRTRNKGTPMAKTATEVRVERTGKDVSIISR